MKDNKISLVLATKGRDKELNRFLSNLANQSYTDFELILVDQNEDDRVRNVVINYPNLNIKYLNSKPGLSRARNAGLRVVTGDIIGFPDDDCWYAQDVLERVNLFYTNHLDYQALTGKSTGEEGGNLWKWDKTSGEVDKINIWRRANSNSIFTRFETIEKGIVFDENLGVGSGTHWGSGEEIDFLLRILESGGRIFYDPSLVVFHENTFPKGDREAIKKAYSYACGMGYVLRKMNYSILIKVEYLLKPLLYAIFSFIFGDLYRARFKWATFRGRTKGLFSK